MNEADWLTCTDPRAMIEFLERALVPADTAPRILPFSGPTPGAQAHAQRPFQAAGARRLRLFGAACCRRFWTYLHDERLREALAVAESYADGAGTERDRIRAMRLARRALRDAQLDRLGFAAVCCARAVYRQTFRQPAPHAARVDTYRLTRLVAREAGEAVPEATDEIHRFHSAVLRCIFGYPYRAAEADPAWLLWNEGSVARMAEGVYQERAFDRLPILADALEDAGCDHSDVLAHCRAGTDHARGCWVVDLLLHKT
jgi:hypothetical protein